MSWKKIEIKQEKWFNVKKNQLEILAIRIFKLL